MDKGFLFECRIIENHDEAYAIWKERDIRNATVLHVDAHSDFTNFSECFYMTIGNYLNYAWSEEIINCVIWVIPDMTFRDSEKMNVVLSRLTDFTITSVLNLRVDLVLKLDSRKKLVITSIEYIEKLVLETVDSLFLIDIDIDFFMNPDIRNVYSYFHLDSFWLDMNFFCKIIQKIIEKCTIMTVSKSIIGGYTPLIYSYISSYIFEFVTKRSNVFFMIDRAVRALTKKQYQQATRYFHMEFDKGNRTLTCLLGLVYSYVGIGDWRLAKMYYSMVASHYKQYETYFFPVFGLIKEHMYEEAESLVKIWLKLDSSSQQAILYRIKILLLCNCNEEKKIEALLTKITDENTCFEKSYICIQYYRMIGSNVKAIQCGKRVLKYLRINETPTWVGQISSFEKHKNHGIVFANIHYLLACIYYDMGDYRQAVYNAKISKRIGLRNDTISKILEHGAD